MAMAENLFVYGTLQFPRLIQAVLGQVPVAQPATLHGFSRYQLRRRVFPAIIRESDRFVTGQLITNLDRWAIERLDDYEGPPFRRERVRAHIPDQGITLDAWVYILRPRYRLLLLDRDWDPEAFRGHSLTALVHECTAIYGTGC